MQSHSLILSRAESEVVDFLLGRAPAGPREISEGIGRTDASMRSLLPKMVREGKIERPSRGLYAELDYGGGWIPNPLPGIVLLRHPDLSPFTYRGAAADVGFLLSALRGMADHYADELGTESSELMRRQADELDAATSALRSTGKPPPP
jgi:hypothetical protein